MSLLMRALKEAFGVRSAKKTAAHAVERGRIPAVPALAELPQVATASRQIVKPLYAAYLRDVSKSAWVISFQSACALHGLCTLLRPAAILDLGSGFTSAAFRFYAKTAAHPCSVHSVDDDAQWLERTREFLAAQDLSTADLMLWPAFCETSGAYDLILHDLGNMATREQSLGVALARRAASGLLVLDDMHLEPYATRARKSCEMQGLRWFDLRDLTLDNFGRYVTLVTPA